MAVNHTSRTRRIISSAVLGTALLAAAVPATSFAGEVGSGGGGGGGTTTCSPISSLVVKADARAGETGLASMDVSYGVKACTNGQLLTASVNVSEYLNPSVVVYDNPNAPLNGKFTVFGIRVRVTYKVTVTAYDAATGAVAGTQSAYVAAIPKGV